MHNIVIASFYLYKISARRIVLDINANFHHNVIFLKIFAKGKTNSLLYKYILAFFSFQTDLSPQNRHSHRADAIYCVSIETAKPFKRRRHSISEARNLETAPATETTKKNPRRSEDFLLMRNHYYFLISNSLMRFFAP